MRERSRALWTRLGQLDPRWLVSFLITLVLVLGEARYGILGGYDRLAVALGVCVATELTLSRWVRGRFANPQSAYITGISLALLIKPRVDLLWPFALGGFLAIASKYVLQYRGRHLWNPSNFAIALLVLAAPASIAILSRQWGNDLATNAVIWCFGLLIVTRVRMLHVTLTYVAGFVALAALRHWIVGGPLLAEIAPITGPMYQLFIFFMITDPKTTVSTVRGRIIVAAAVAVAEARAESALSGAADPRPRDRRPGRESDRSGPHPLSPSPFGRGGTTEGEGINGVRPAVGEAPAAGRCCARR